MKLTVILSVVGLIAFFACNNKSSSEKNFEDAVKTAQQIKDTSASVKKYQIKSATITYENTVKSGDFVITQKSIVYFDDYGMKERKDTYDDEDNLTESFFSDGTTLYLLLHKENKAFDRGKAFRGTEFKFDWEEISASEKEKDKVEKGVNEMVAGKDCEVFYHETDLGKTKFAGWNNICLLTEASGSYGETVNRAVDINEGPVAANLFIVPKDYSLEKY